MQILARVGQAGGGHQVMVFGLGMIGSQIRDALCRMAYRVVAELPYHWDDRARRDEDGRAIEAWWRAQASEGARLSLVWSAGRAGFFSSPAEMAAETGCVADAISLARRLRTVMSGCRLDFHFISSAGGLFEGQRTVHARSRPRPVRPYGQAKLAQEELLRRSFERGQLQIYRPSSVYGPLHRKPRQGLINTLVDDARGGRVTVLDANVMSLRDYVFAGDIGAFVARAVAAWRHDPQAPDVRFLVSARCTSIQEAMQKVQRTLSLRVNYRLDRDFGNSRHITFHPDVLPPGWRPSTLDVGIRQFLVSR